MISTPPPNLPSVLSLDLNTRKGAAGELATDYFQMIRNKDQVIDKYKARIDKGEKFQMNLKDALKGSTLISGALYRCGIAVLGKDIWKYKKENERHQDDKHLIVLKNTAKSHQKRLQTYHELIANKKKQDRSLYTAQDWKNYLIVRKIKDDTVLPRCNSSDVKPKMIELEINIGHKSAISIREIFIYRDEPAHLVDQVIHDMEGIGDASSEGANGMGQLFVCAFLVDGSSAI